VQVLEWPDTGMAVRPIFYSVAVLEAAELIGVKAE
jgi:hypothetical protein